MQRTSPTKKRATATTLTPTVRPVLPPPAHHRVLSTVAVDEARLLRSIQALDAASDPSFTSTKYPHAVITSVLHALAYFLEISIHLEESVDEATRQQVALVLEARVLSCITRFLEGKARRRTGHSELRTPEDHKQHAAWKSWCCEAVSGGDLCVGGVIRTALLCFLFQLTRQAASAVLVLRSGLHTFLLDQCRPLHVTSDATIIPQCSTYDARDQLIGVDPFDWSTRGLFSALRREGPDCEIFLLPIGARTLSYLLQARRIPTNEAEELAIQLHNASHAMAPVSLSSPSKGPLRNGQRKKPKPRGLPSIFQFATQCDDISQDPEPCIVCLPRYDANVWKTVRLEATRMQFAVRAVVTLALHLPPASPEHKKFQRDGGLEVLKRVATGDWELMEARTLDSDCIPTQMPAENAPVVSQHVEFVRALGMAGVRLFENEAAANELQPTLGESPKRVVATPKSPLRDKLQAITEENRRQVALLQRQQLLKQRAEERQQLRRRVRELFDAAQQTWAHLLESLAVLSTGRDHPAGPNQSIVEWLDSFPTIEKKEQQRQEEEEQRQRRLLELQYLVEERRRRQRDECLLMAKNDFDTPNTHEKERESAKKEAFQRLQQEMRAMEQREREETHKHEQDGETKRLAALEELRRVQLVADQLQREAKENELMKKEDTYYAEKILREKQRREQQEKLDKQIDPIAEQKKRIERMRLQDRERKQVEQDVEAMRSEDLLARQMRFVENQRHKEQVEREWKARRQMEAEERFLRQQWKRIDEAAAKQHQDHLKQQRAEERRLKREQEQWKAWQASWITSYDAYGNAYYYNQLTGETQWENPFQYWTGAQGDVGAAEKAAAPSKCAYAKDYTREHGY